MGRKIILTGRNAQYIEHRAVNATADSDREIRMEGEDAVYREYAYGQASGQQGGRQEAPSNVQTEGCKLLAAASGEAGQRLDAEELLARLKPIFYNNEDDVRLFLQQISGMTPGDVTDLVNTWVSERRISGYGNSRKGVLWEILSEAGLYTKSRQNWNRRVY